MNGVNFQAANGAAAFTAIYSGPEEEDLIGFIRANGDGRFEAFDTGEVLLDVFADEDAAADAVLDDCFGVRPRSNGGYVTHDKVMASTFLSGLDPTATRFTFQTFDDNKDRKSKALARVLHGTLDECFAELTRLNNLGAGIFVTTSETNFLGRSTKNIIRPRALFYDADGDEQVTHATTVIEAHDAIPSMTVISGGGRHGYYICDDIPLDQFSALQKSLAAKLGTDRNVHDLPRVMRLPGMLHLKDPSKPRLVKLVATDGAVRRWKLADLIAKLRLSTTTPDRTNGGVASDGHKIETAEAFRHLDPRQGLGQGIEPPPLLPLEPILAECGWLRHVRDTGGSDQSEVLWRDALRVCMFLEQGESLIHEFSKKHAEYDPAATEAKYDRARKDKEDNDLGYPKCQTICDHGSEHCKGCPHLAAEGSPLHLAVAAKGVTLADFRAYLPDHSYIFTPTGAFWAMAGVNACFGRGANKLIDRNQQVHHLTWAPGHPMLIENQLVVDGGWIERNGVTTFNLYRPPTLKHGDPSKAGPWLELVHKVYPEDAERLIAKLAHRVQRPQEKINHAVVMGGAPGIGKDTILEPVKRAVGPWNFKETSPQQILGRFNGYLQSVIMRISEVRDLGEFNRYQFYEHTKTYFAAPPDVLRVDEKNIPEHDVMNCTFAILTTNRLTDGIFLPPDDRRHDVMWSELTKDDFTESYWIKMWRWYDEGGDGHVAAYLATLDISAFNPKAPPPKTAAFWAIVDANRAPEEGELQDLLDKLGNPDAVTLKQVIQAAGGVDIGPYGDKGNIANWLADRKNRRSIPHRLDSAGYVPVRNDACENNLWVIAGVRQVVYAKKDILPRDRLAAVTALHREADEKIAAAKAAAAKAAARAAAKAAAERHKAAGEGKPTGEGVDDVLDPKLAKLLDQKADAAQSPDKTASQTPGTEGAEQ